MFAHDVPPTSACQAATMSVVTMSVVTGSEQPVPFTLPSPVYPEGQWHVTGEFAMSMSVSSHCACGVVTQGFAA